MMNKSLGRLERVELRDIWLSEASDFTPWLARKENLDIRFVPTSYQMEIAVRSLKLQTTQLEEDMELDLALDGADQVQWRSLDMVKGGGAALLREKIVD